MNKLKHIAVIPDGNRRWAEAQGLKAFEGHRAAIKKTIELANYVHKLGVNIVTLWGFSTENWKRSAEEVEYLMSAFYKGMKRYAKDLRKNKTRFILLGRRDRLPKKLVNYLVKLEEETKEFGNDRVICIGLDYGGRDEILRMVKKAVSSEGVTEDDITEEWVSQHLDTKGIPDPDVILRTGGEKRLSGYLPWQGVYSELFFIDKSFPALTVEDIQALVDDFNNRTRTFGGNARKINYI